VIEIPTTLVLGAGASHAYGLPLNSGLSSALYKIGDPDNARHRILVAAGFPSAKIIEFSTEFKLSQAPSIDEFLSHRAEEYSTIGKAAIAMIIREHESPDLLLEPQDAHDPRAEPDHWYKYLWDRLTEGATFETLDRNRLTVVTFNYDRSLETYLSYVMGARFRKTPDECTASRSKGWLKILHVYGEVVGNYGWNATSVDALVPSIRNDALEAMRVIPEGRDDDPGLLKARAALLSAKRICFLGFSFQKPNLDRLDSKVTCSSDSPVGHFREVWGTAYGLKNKEIHQAESRCGLHVGRYWPRPREPMNWPGFYNWKCLDLLRESLVLSSPEA
jgi:hypothetical protein